MPRHVKLVLDLDSYLDATDLMLLQFPELWDNTRNTFYDVYYYGAEAP